MNVRASSSTGKQRIPGRAGKKHSGKRGNRKGASFTISKTENHEETGRKFADKASGGRHEAQPSPHKRIESFEKERGY